MVEPPSVPSCEVETIAVAASIPAVSELSFDTCDLSSIRNTGSSKGGSHSGDKLGILQEIIGLP